MPTSRGVKYYEQEKDARAIQYVYSDLTSLIIRDEREKENTRVYYEGGKRTPMSLSAVSYVRAAGEMMRNWYDFQKGYPAFIASATVALGTYWKEHKADVLPLIEKRKGNKRPDDSLDALDWDTWEAHTAFLDGAANGMHPEMRADKISEMDAPVVLPLPEGVCVLVGYRCLECEEISDDANPSTLYECGTCGTKYNRDNSADGSSNRCPDCNKFGAKIADCSCASCEEGELETIDVFPCPTCEELIEHDPATWTEHCSLNHQDATSVDPD